MIFCMAISLFATNMLAQEVRGIETKRVVYTGEEYKLYVDTRWGSREEGKSDKYFGFELTNQNSISVSVTIEVYKKGNPDKMIEMKEIVLKSKECYVQKYPSIQKYQGEPYNEGDYTSRMAYRESRGRSEAEQYYVKYKAYKLQ